MYIDCFLNHQEFCRLDEGMVGMFYEKPESLTFDSFDSFDSIPIIKPISFSLNCKII